ncbi:hypothetical protein J4734_25425 [Klebsiella pneumoniae]|uniref:Uncharacterized protein n=1 Tax=Klebsiella pneumoniae TaxID=573 RepID=A0A939NSQ8_KLEPN|nr:hypothetical protein [Klebsiella pneumoniae]
MAQQIELRRSRAASNTFQSPAGAAATAFPAVGRAATGVDQLFKCGSFADGRSGSAHRSGAEPGETRLFQPRRDADVILRAAVQRDGVSDWSWCCLAQCAIVAHGAEPAGGKIEAYGSWPSGPLALRPAVVISAEPGVDGHAVLLLQVEESERWHGFSGAGSGKQAP